jgi:shikimate kinase / 3-dehydroquinate synthase
VLATGGGTLLSAENRALLEERHTVICLTADRDELQRRLVGGSERPLLRSAGSLVALLAERAPIYGLFPTVDTTCREPDEVATDVITEAALAVAGELNNERFDRSIVVVERGAGTRLAPFLGQHGLAGDIFLIADETVHELGHVAGIREPLEAEGLRVTVAIVPSGEEHKTLSTLEKLYRRCLESNLDRSAIVVGVGGGVVCDLAGTVAATYLRGLRLVVLPSTLLAQVDAAIGGKVGVDLDGVKNIVGAFYPANLVVIDPDLLGTLPETLLSDGAAEIIKIAFVRSASLLEALEGLTGAADLPSRLDIIRAAASCKIRVVQMDPFERGERMMLNFGHTVGHAVETASDYRLSHGQSVGIGMAAETRLAVGQGICPPDVLLRLETLLRRLGLPTSLRSCGEQGLDIGVDQLVNLMAHDKKRAGTSLRFALPTGTGTGEVVTLAADAARRAAEYAFEEQP